MGVVLLILLLALVAPGLIWWADLVTWWEARPAVALRSGIKEILATYAERVKDPSRSAFPVRPVVVTGFQQAFYYTLSRVLTKAGVSLDVRKDLREEVVEAASRLAQALSKDLVEQAKCKQSAG